MASISSTRLSACGWHRARVERGEKVVEEERRGEKGGREEGRGRGRGRVREGGEKKLELTVRVL